MKKSVKKKIAWTPAQRAEHRAIQEQSKHDRPSLDELYARGETDEPVTLFQVLALRVLLKKLKAERERLKLSLTDVSERSGLSRAMISRLENGWSLNPTLDTLYRYGLGIGQCIELGAEDLPAEEAQGGLVPARQTRARA
jgi:hypothetical protein